NCVKIQHDNGYSTLYAHMAYITVGYGARVVTGQIIGRMGNTGNSYGAHLHFEVRDGDDDRTDPTPYLNSDLPGEAPEESYPLGTYRVDTAVLTVREGAGVDFPWISYEDLTPNARAQIEELTGGTPNGYVQNMVCDVSAVQGNWGRTPSGWICLDYCAAR
ncbi:MAG: M23 family metallopeptidase, partial [Oscillospiraceae bacterium]